MKIYTCTATQRKLYTRAKAWLKQPTCANTTTIKVISTYCRLHQEASIAVSLEDFCIKINYLASRCLSLAMSENTQQFTDLIDSIADSVNHLEKFDYENFMEYIYRNLLPRTYKFYLMTKAYLDKGTDPVITRLKMD